MNTFMAYLFVIALLALITLPSLVGYARERSIDRQLREAAARGAVRAGQRARQPIPSRREYERSA
ncbi:hypothetical protein [Streptomyces sp. NPDC020681]|uniref:hypothetical protein n=1 Tax=Streptomyces sp. NPDC020681 TaxID=3365083 RepID=UPI0037A18D7E